MNICQLRSEAVYYREESVFKGLFGRFNSITFIKFEIERIARFLPQCVKAYRWMDDDGYPTSFDEYPLPAIFLSDESPVDWYLAEECHDKPCMKVARLGDYYFDKHLITLYVPNIEGSLNDDNNIYELKTTLSIILAHELFHSFQYFISPKKASRYRYVDKKGKCNAACKIMEATADFFAFIWLTEGMYSDGTGEFARLREERFQSWLRNSFDFWPYAGAKYFVQDGYGQKTSVLAGFHEGCSLEKFQLIMKGFAKPGVPLKTLIEGILSDMNSPFWNPNNRKRPF